MLIAHTYTYANGYTDRHVDAYPYFYSNGNTNCNRDAYAKAFTGTAASSDTATSPIVE